MIPAIKFPHGRAVLEQPRCDHCGAEWESGWDDDFMVALADVEHPCPRRPADDAARYWLSMRRAEDQLIKVATFTKATCPSPGLLCDGIIERIKEMTNAEADVAQKLGFTQGFNEGSNAAAKVILSVAKGLYVAGKDADAAVWRKIAHSFAEMLEQSVSEAPNA